MNSLEIQSNWFLLKYCNTSVERHCSLSPKQLQLHQSLLGWQLLWYSSAAIFIRYTFDLTKKRPIVVLHYHFDIYGTKSLQKISPLYSIDWWRSCRWEDVSPGNCSTSRSSSKLLRHLLLASVFCFLTITRVCLCVNLQTGQSWHWSRITNSDGCYCHVLHSLGCIWRMQSSSISLHRKLLNY